MEKRCLASAGALTTRVLVSQGSRALAPTLLSRTQCQLDAHRDPASKTKDEYSISKLFCGGSVTAALMQEQGLMLVTDCTTSRAVISDGCKELGQFKHHTNTTHVSFAGTKTSAAFVKKTNKYEICH